MNELTKKRTEISKSSERKVGIILSYTQMLLNAVTSLLYAPIMLRLMGKNEYGLYNTLNTTISFIWLLDMGFSSSYVKFYSKYKSLNQFDKINSFNSLYFTVFSAIAAISAAIGLFLTFNLRLVFDEGLTNSEYSKARIMMLAMTVSMALGFITTIFGSYISVHQKFIFTKSFGLANTIATFIVDIIVLYLGFGAVGIVFATLILGTIHKCINIFYSYKKLHFKFDFKHIEKELFRQVFSFSGLIAINMIVDKVNSGIDSVLLGRFCGTAAVAVYAIGASINSQFTSFSTAISGIFTPHIHSLVNAYEMDSKEQRSALTALFIKVGRVQYLLLALIASGFVFFGQKFIYFWAGEGYEKSYYVALLLIIPAIVPLIQNVGIEIQRAENRHHYRSYIYGAMAIINLIVSIFLCQIWEGIGCAAGTAFALITANGIIMNIVYHKKINIDIIQFWKNILRQTLGMILPFICGTLIMKFAKINSIFELVFYIIVYTAVYCVCVWFMSANNYEKSLITDFLKKFSKKRIH